MPHNPITMQRLSRTIASGGGKT